MLRSVAAVALASVLVVAMAVGCDASDADVASSSEAGPSDPVPIDSPVGSSDDDAGDAAVFVDPFAPCPSCKASVLLNDVAIVDIAVRGGTLYFSDGDSLHAMPATGGAPTVVLAEAGIGGMSLDETGVYWPKGPEIRRAALEGDGGESRVLYSRDGGTMLGVVANGKDGYVWFGFTEYSGPLQGALATVDIDGGADASFEAKVNRLCCGGGGSFSGPVGRGASVVFRVQTWGTLYFAESLHAIAQGKAAGLENANDALGTNLGPAIIDGTRAYWVLEDQNIDGGAELRTMVVGEDASTPLVSGHAFWALMVDATHLYALSYETGRIVRMPKTGGALVPFMDIPPPTAEANIFTAWTEDGTNVYVATQRAIYVHPK